ncbi:MAG: LysM peptidoglycan-binding domain-containing protein [Verrucomicrobiota bacterium]|jgi:LysM repeat protein|nr:LysM peptidoglycan-binding domain-containing protein [Verrucomicrobiota bacterium]
MKTILSYTSVCSVAVAFALFTTGCITTQEPSGPPAASQAEVVYLREEMRRLNDRLNASEAELGHVQRNVLAAQSAQPSLATTAQVQSMQAQLDSLQQQIRSVDAARAKDKKDIYDDITRKVTTLVKSSTPTPPRPAARSSSQSGYEHVVQSGESLSKIAAAYGVKMSVIMTENKLKNADNIFVGQKLFIPD